MALDRARLPEIRTDRTPPPMPLRSPAAVRGVAGWSVGRVGSSVRLRFSYRGEAAVGVAELGLDEAVALGGAAIVTQDKVPFRLKGSPFS